MKKVKIFKLYSYDPPIYLLKQINSTYFLTHYFSFLFYKKFGEKKRFLFYFIRLSLLTLHINILTFKKIFLTHKKFLNIYIKYY